jgi:AcrR family transcriptional regulator
MSILHFENEHKVAPNDGLKIRKGQKTRAAILNSTLDLLWKQPFRDLTVKSVMAPTGVSRSAFYLYFRDLEEVIETLLDISKSEIYSAVSPWYERVGDPVAILQDGLSGLVDVSSQRGPILRAVVDAATTNQHLEDVWDQLMGGFDDAASARIEADQEQGLIANFDARNMAITLNRLNSSVLIEAFGHHPTRNPEAVRDSLFRIWTSTLYGSEWVEKKSSPLVRK